jgi:amino acid transporter
MWYQMASQEQGETELERSIGWKGVTASAIGLVVASTTFAGNFNGFGAAGPGYFLALLIGFTVNVLVMFAYFELATMFPKAGQIFEFTKRSFTNKRTAIVLGVGTALAYWIALAFATSGEFIAGASAMVQSTGFGSVLLWILIINLIAIGLNLAGLRLAVAVEIILVIIMVGVRVLLGIGALAGLSQAGPPDFSLYTTNFAPGGFSAIASVTALAVFSFVGLEFSTPLVEEIVEPGKNLPKGGVIGVIAVFFMTVVMGFGIMAVLSPLNQPHIYTGNAPQIKIAGILFGTSGEIVVGIASFAATLGTVIVLYAAIPRIIYAMAREDLLPSFLAKVHPRSKAPWAAIIVTAILFNIPRLFSGNVVTLVNASVAVWLLAYLWVFALAIKLRYTHPELNRPFSMNIGIYIIGIGLILLVLWQAYKGSYQLIVIGLLLFALSILFSVIWTSFMEETDLNTIETLTDARVSPSTTNQDHSED